MIDILLAAQCADVAVPEATEQALAYYQSGNILWLVQQGWALVIPLLLLFSGISGKLSSWIKGWDKSWYATIFFYLVFFLAILSLLNLPLDYYGGYVREHEFGLSNQTFGRWLGNWSKTFLITFIAAAAFIWIFYLVIRKSPNRWWLYASIVSIVITFVSLIVQPIWIDPLFNEFGPMQDKKLEARILKLAEKAGIENSRIYEVDMSQDTRKVNAYVIGVGPVKRIVLWDTTLKKLSSDEVLFVMGHEMGHYVLNHIWWYMLYMSAASFAVFYLVYKSANYLLGRFWRSFRFDRLADIASLPLMIFLIGFYTLLLSPLSNVISRTMERQADRFGLEITKNNKAAAKMFAAATRENLGNPRPGLFYIIWRSDHPPLGERIEFCNSYCPWRQDEPLKYGKYFSPSLRE